MITFKILKHKLGPILGRHPWVFSGAVENIPQNLESGELVKLIDENGNFLAQGYYNAFSQIAVRLWSFDENEEVDNVFFEKRIIHAYELRKKYVELENTNSYRLINSENDFLPGLVVDKYADYLVVQYHTKGIERWKKEIVEALEKIVMPKGIYERSDVSVRKIEGAEEKTGVILGEVPDLITITENGLKFLVDVKQGQKTGFFLDQRDKRRALMKYVKDKPVLNTFSYTGGFSVYALAGGAKEVVNVDVSAQALELAKENIKLNSFDLDKCSFIRDDVKQYLRSAEQGKFEVIVLDPPAFIKDRRKKKEGVNGYRNINESALRILANEGILVSCSCSAHLSLQDFRYLISEAAGRAKRSARFLETFIHGIDHPELVPFTESEYLKCFFMEA